MRRAPFSPAFAAALLSLPATVPSLAADAATGDSRTVPGQVIVQPPTLQSLGIEWPLSGDANRNASVRLQFRKIGAEAWRDGLPPLRVGGEEVRSRPFDVVVPHAFVGSVFDLEPGTDYELRLQLTDPDGVQGTAEHVVRAHTRAEPKPAADGGVFHVYPRGYKGPRQEPAFEGLLAAYYTGSSHSDWANSFPARAQPGDTILVHAGTYRDERQRYGGGLGTVFDGTYYLTTDATAERPIAIKAAGDGEVVFDGAGNGVLFDVTSAPHHYFEGITFRGTEIAILAGRKRILGADGLVVKRSRFEDVGIGIHTDWAGSKDFYIADNVFVGRQMPKRMVGWIGKTWQGYPEFPTPLLSNYAVKVYGSGHVIVHNDISHFHDGIDHATYGNPDPEGRGVSIDIIGNDIRNVDDNCIEVDGATSNARVLRNRCFNQAHRALSAQPLLGGPAYFIGNLVYHAPEGGSLKLQGAPAGVVFYHNTLIGEAHDMGPASNLHFRNNLILGQGAYPEIFTVDTFTNWSTSDYNGFRPNPGAATAFVWNSPADGAAPDYKSDRVKRSYPTLAAYAKATGQDRHSRLVDYTDFLRVTAPDPADPTRFYSPQEFDFSLKPRSRAVDAGEVLPNVNDGFTGRAPDLGAFERGRPMPVYGPRP